MGTIHHNAMTITVYGPMDDDLEDKEGKYGKRLREHAASIGLTLHGPFPSEMNGYVSYFLPPDGSKEGWATSNEGDEKRRLLAKWLSSHAEYDWVDVAYGELGVSIQQSSDN